MTILRRLILAAILAISATLVIAQAKPQETEKIELGKLGQALKAATIFSKPSTKSKTYYKTKEYQYLVIQNSSKDGWLQVLMENGAYGYIKSEAVATFAYVVTLDVPKGNRDYQNLSSRSRASAARNGLNYQGTPYKWGGNDPTRGIDCSGFVKYLFGQIGVDLPRTAAEQVKVGTPITKLEDLKEGDRLYFWDHKRNKVGHTGIYLGNGYFVHSSSSNKGVATDYLGDAKWLKILVAARR
ncbi:MAG: C40 family peptidase [Fimbriimonadaceae bacterium]|nr:C40 family peptidase [Fimbriimonadaceae bacterium]